MFRCGSSLRRRLAIERHPHRAVKEILGARDQALDFVRTQDDGETAGRFGYGRSSFMSRRFNTRRKKNRSAAISATTVPTASFRSSSR